MENFFRYRENLSRNIKSEPDKERKRNILKLAKQSKDYEESKDSKLEYFKQRAKAKSELINGISEEKVKELLIKNRFDNEMPHKPYSFARNFFDKDVVEDIKKHPELLEIFRKYQLVDIACGNEDLASQIIPTLDGLGVKKYTGVDYHNINFIDEEYYQYPIERNKSGEINKSLPILTAFRKEDMLSFLKSLPDKSTNILISGFDIYIQNPKKTKEGWQYIARLLPEMARVVPDDGFILSIESNLEGSYNNMKFSIEDFGFKSGKICKANVYYEFLTKQIFKDLEYGK